MIDGDQKAMVALPLDHAEVDRRAGPDAPVGEGVPQRRMLGRVTRLGLHVARHQRLLGGWSATWR